MATPRTTPSNDSDLAYYTRALEAAHSATRAQHRGAMGEEFDQPDYEPPEAALSDEERERQTRLDMQLP